MSQINPRDPVHTNAAFHPEDIKIQAINGGPAMAAIFVPLLKIPVANARSFLGNHSATDLIAAGKLPDSPRPSAVLAIPNPSVLDAIECNIAATLHIIIEIVYPSRVPILSINLPNNKSPNA